MGAITKLVSTKADSKKEELQVKKTLAGSNGEAPPESVPPKKLSQKTMVVMGLANLALVLALLIFLVTQFSPKPLKNIEWGNYNPPLSVYPEATLIASDSNGDGTFRHVWWLYASKDNLSKIQPYYQDQFLGLDYKQDNNNTLFPLGFYRTEGNGCLNVRYGLDVVSLDENPLELPGIDSLNLKRLYPGETIFVLHQLDTASREPTC